MARSGRTLAAYLRPGLQFPRVQGNGPYLVKRVAHKRAIGMKGGERPSAEGLDLWPRRFRPWCLAVVILHSDNAIASNGQVAPQLACLVLAGFTSGSLRPLGASSFL